MSTFTTKNEDRRNSMPTLRHLRRAARAVSLAVALTALAGSAPALADDASFGAHDLTVTASSDLAGAHPDVTTSFAFNTRVDANLGEIPAEPIKTVRLSLPAGLVGDAANFPQCPPKVFTAGAFVSACPDNTQVGVVVLTASLTGEPFAPLYFPVFNVAPGDGKPATFGFAVIIPNVLVGFGVRTATDGGLDTVIDGINEGARLAGQSLTLWGVPADPSHDTMRASCMDPYFGGGPTGATCPASGPRLPLLRNPTSCAPMTTTLSVASWVHPDRFRTSSVTQPALTGCQDVPFAPSVAISPETTSADAPTGLDVTVGVAQNRDPDGRGAADVRRAVVTLPEGYSISPSAADGLKACDAAHVGIGAAGPPDCPDASKVGSATIVSPILAKPLTGPIYLGPSPSPGSYKVYVVVEANGVRLKLSGDIVADPQTGQLTTTFDNTPQEPFSSFRLHFDGGPRAVLASPATCGTANASSALTPWSAAAGEKPVTLTSPVALGGGDCPAAAPFAPSASAGVTNPVAGADTGFTLHVGREDRTQALGAISAVTLPRGLVARVGSVPTCPSAAAAAGTCDAASRVGSVSVTAGPGAAPLHLAGTAYLTDGYKGAPYGLSLVVPALAGPYDLGTVVVRSAIRVARDSQITVETDPLPQVLAGIPLRLRGIDLALDRAGFMINPTSCDDATIGIQMAAAGGATASSSSRFGLTGCRALPFKPAIRASATASTRAAGAGLHVALTQTPGQAHLKSVAFTLPKQMGIRIKALGTVCTADQLKADACPAASQIGGASARTPILPDPLKGAVYLVQAGSSLPAIVAVLRGGGLTIELDGTTSTSKDGRLTTTFGTIPDVPISTFDLDLPHTKRQILETTRLPCSGTSASVTFLGQNGAKLSKTVPVSGSCRATRKAAGSKAKATR